MSALRIEGRRSEAGLTLIEVLVSIIIMGIISTMLIAGWINLQRASANAVSTNNARATVRDAMDRISSELRGAQPTSLPTPIPTLSATATPTPAPPITVAQPMDVQFYSAYNSALASADGSGVSLAALRLTRIWLDTATVPPAPWNPEGRTLYLQRDTNSSNTIDAGDRVDVLARNVVNNVIPDPTTDGPSHTSSTPVFRYAYRATAGGPVLWTDNETSSLDLSEILAVRVRLIIDKSLSRGPNFVDITTTLRLRNASSE
jgi:prepilin-type N-terminal cleavage/methylation domain-containing protein